MRVLGERFPVSAVNEIESAEPGLYDVTMLHMEDERIISDERLSKFGEHFLNLMQRSLEDAEVDLSPYAEGGMYYRVIDLSRRDAADKGGRFHYDTRRPVGDLRKDEGPLRIVSALSSDGTDISNVFTDNASYRGRLIGDVLNENPSDLFWPGNGTLVEFDEELDLHAQPPAIPLRLGSKAVFASAILRRPHQDVIACEAFSRE